MLEALLGVSQLKSSCCYSNSCKDISEAARRLLDRPLLLLDYSQQQLVLYSTQILKFFTKDQILEDLIFNLICLRNLKKMQKLEIWIERHHPRLGAMQYHPSAKWLEGRGYDPRLAKKVHITRASSLLSKGQLLKHPAVILHELAHNHRWVKNQARFNESFAERGEAS